MPVFRDPAWIVALTGFLALLVGLVQSSRQRRDTARQQEAANILERERLELEERRADWENLRSIVAEMRQERAEDRAEISELRRVNSRLLDVVSTLRAVTLSEIQQVAEVDGAGSIIDEVREET